MCSSRCPKLAISQRQSGEQLDRSLHCLGAFFLHEERNGDAAEHVVLDVLIVRDLIAQVTGDGVLSKNHCFVHDGVHLVGEPERVNIVRSGGFDPTQVLAPLVERKLVEHMHSPCLGGVAVEQCLQLLLVLVVGNLLLDGDLVNDRIVVPLKIG